jgi:MoaA/NifB/PqqE/SkfB family radical SAM enzyme
LSKSLHPSKTFCLHPFTGLATREDGAVKACCRSLPVGWIQDNSLEEIWNNGTMREIRRQVLCGERPGACEPCFNLEDQGVESLRQRHIRDSFPDARSNLYPNALDSLRDDYSMPFEFPTIEIKINNLCNLKCRMCNPLDSTQWKDWEQVEQYYKDEGNYLVDAVSKLNLMQQPYVGLFEVKQDFWDNLEKLLPYFRRIEFAGGEPLMDPYHYKILDMLAPYGDNIELKYATNGTTLGIKGRSIEDYWPKFKRIVVNVSIDGIDDVYEYIRGNGTFKEVEENVKLFKSFANVDYVVGAMTVQANNILQLPKCIDYFLNSMGIVFYSHRVTYPRVLSAQVIPQPLKEKVITELQTIQKTFRDYPIVRNNPALVSVTERQVADNINFLKNDLSQYWQDCINFNRALDKTRNQDFLSINPEFKSYIE